MFTPTSRYFATNNLANVVNKCGYYSLYISMLLTGIAAAVKSDYKLTDHHVLGSSVSTRELQNVDATMTTSLHHYQVPLQKWSAQLPRVDGESDPSLRKGNAVQVSPDDQLVYVTTNFGNLYIFGAEEGSLVAQHKISPLRSSWRVACDSGISFYNGSDVKFGIYAIIDLPPDHTGKGQGDHSIYR